MNGLSLDLGSCWQHEAADPCVRRCPGFIADVLDTQCQMSCSISMERNSLSFHAGPGTRPGSSSAGSLTILKVEGNRVRQQFHLRMAFVQSVSKIMTVPSLSSLCASLASLRHHSLSRETMSGDKAIAL